MSWSALECQRMMGGSSKELCPNESAKTRVSIEAFVSTLCLNESGWRNYKIACLKYPLFLVQKWLQQM